MVDLVPGGHFLHRESPERFEAALLKWLAKHREQRAAGG